MARFTAALMIPPMELTPASFPYWYSSGTSKWHSLLCPKVHWAAASTANTSFSPVQIYALNRVMTELEQQQFDEFCKQMQPPGEWPPEFKEMGPQGFVNSLPVLGWDGPFGASQN